MAKTLIFDADDVQEGFFRHGWTDGLPIVAPTCNRVCAMFDGIQSNDPMAVVGLLSASGAGISLEQPAINCRGPASSPLAAATRRAGIRS